MWARQEIGDGRGRIQLEGLAKREALVVGGWCRGTRGGVDEAGDGNEHYRQVE
jgi:hypothetical protein